MCTAYELGKRGGSFPARVGAKAVRELLSIEKTKLLRPTLKALVVLPDGSLESMRWGFARKFSHAVVNSREDKLDGGMWRDAVENRRCLIPVAAYYEWSGPRGEKRTHRFTAADKGWLWIAGIWEENVELGRCFSMITTEPRGVVRGVHDRMPAVLSVSETDVFLNGAMRTFRPQEDLLLVADSVNPLTGKRPGPVQGDLFTPSHPTIFPGNEGG